MQQYENTTKGHWYGHWFRRVIHVSMVSVPFLYYDAGDALAGMFGLTPPVLIGVFLLLTALIEALRLSTGIVLFGQRKHEARRISSFSWGALGIALVLWFAPSRAFASAIVWSLALGDPCLGEARRRLSTVWTIIFGLLTVLAVWWGCAYWFGISYWWGALMAPITVAAEWPRLRGVDDNLLMLTIPLTVVLVVQVALHLRLS